MYSFTYLPIKRVFYGLKSNRAIDELLKPDFYIYILTGSNTSRSEAFKNIIENIEHKKFNYEILPFISQHSPMDEIQEAYDSIKNAKGKFILIAYGGGSVIDASKILKSISLPEYVIAIPTTLSAAEFSNIAGYSEGSEKKGIRDLNIVPDYIILDPNNTVSTPREIYLSSGIRSIDHAIESTLDLDRYNPRLYISSDAYKILRDNLLDVSLNGRLMSQIGAWMSYMNVFDSPMGFSHKIGKIIGAKFGIPHGYTSCITLPVMIEYYKINHRLDELLVALYGNKDYDRLIEEISSIIKVISIKTRLRDYGINEEFLDKIYSMLGSKDPSLMEFLRRIY